MNYASYPSLVDRTVLITGGATGIGACMVEQFCAQGSRVAFIDIDQSAAGALVTRLEAARHCPYFVAADLTDSAAIERAITQIHARCGPIAVLINNAANDERHSIEATTSQSWDAGIAANLKHQFFCVQQVIAGMRSLGGGSIVNFGSITWMVKQGGMPVYSASKAAIQGLTRSLARDLGRFKIRVNTIVPGWVMTERQLRLWVTDEGRAEIARNQCLAAELLPEHIARMALFLAADDSAMCTAQNYIVDAGWS